MSDLSKDELFPFDPAAPAYRGKLWVRIVRPDSVSRHFFWRRIACALSVLALALWLGSAAAVWSFVKFQRGYADARYLDLAFYPLRAAHYRAGLGQHYLALGRTEIQNKNYLAGYRLLLAGLARVPDDVAARRLVAYTQVRLGRADLALKTLLDGASHAANNLDYLKLLFGLLHELHEDDRALALAQQLLPSVPDSSLTHQFVALQAATAHFERGRYDTAEHLLGSWRLTDSLDGEILLARCDWERGYPDFALARLERELARFPASDELYVHLVRFYRELGRFGDARRAALLRQFHDPTSPGPRIDLLHAYHSGADRALADRELAAYLTAFQTDRTALLLLAWFAADTAQPALAARIHDLAVTQNFPLNAFNLARIQTALAAEDYRAALAFTDSALLEENEDNSTFLSTVNGLRAVAYFGLKDTARAQLTLTAFLDQTRLRAADALVLAKQLRLLNANSSARDVLARACVTDPLNQGALAELIRLDAESGNRTALATNLPKLFQLRKPSRPVLEETLLHLDEPRDAPLRSQIRAALSQLTATPAPG